MFISLRCALAASSLCPPDKKTIPGTAASAEAGHPLQARSWNAIFAPRGTPPAVLARLTRSLQHAMGDAGLRAQMAALGVELDRVQTNMVFLQVENQLADQLADHLGKQGIRISGRGAIRMVTHLDIDENDVRQVVSEVDRFFSVFQRNSDD